MQKSGRLLLAAWRSLLLDRSGGEDLDKSGVLDQSGLFDKSDVVKDVFARALLRGGLGSFLPRLSAK